MLSAYAHRRQRLASHHRRAHLLVAACLLATFASRAVATEPSRAASTDRIRQTIERLADDDMQGRGLGTNGLKRAAGYIGQQFIEMNLKTDLCDGGMYQTFAVRTRPKGRRQQIDWLTVLRQAGILDDNGKDNKQAEGQGSAPKRTDHEIAPQTNAKSTKAKRRTAKIKNVVAALEGTGPTADETIVVGAHYDHLGQKRDADGELLVYNGANDNASGTAALLEVARILSSRKEKLPRRVVFVAFSGEELGLLGSLHYVDHPATPLKKTIAMINLDMVGQLSGDSVAAMGTGCSPRLAEMATDVAARHDLDLLPIPFSLPCSDHSPFHAHGVPVMFFATTGGMRDYHRPTDTADKLNYEGIHRIAEMTAELTVALAEAEDRPQFVNDGIPSLLMRGAVRLLGGAAKRMVTEPAKKKPGSTSGK